MRSFAFQVATFLIVSTVTFSQTPVAQVSANQGSQGDEQQVRQIEAELVKAEMDSDPAVFEKILTEDCLLLPAGPEFTKTKLVEGVHKSQGQAPPYIARAEDVHVYVLGDTAIAMYRKTYAVRNNPDRVDSQDVTDVFVRIAGTWKLKISRSSPLRKTEN